MRRLTLPLVAVVLAWLFAPAAIGGPVSYVTTFGISMLPDIQAGDLILTRRQGSYGVGDAVAYPSATLNGQTVLHRIVGGDATNGFTFKGDNNDWLDPDHPTGDQIIGAQWLRIPQGGKLLRTAGSPIGTAALGLLVLAASGIGVKVSHGRKNRRTTMGKSPPKDQSHVLATISSEKREWVRIAGVIGVIGLLLTVLAWTRPASGAAADGSAQRSMRFDYRAAVPPSAAYQTDVVTAPQPVFRKLTNKVRVEMGYTGPPGTFAPVAKLSTSSGWTWDMSLGNPVETTSASSEALQAADLDLTEIYDLAVKGTKAAGLGPPNDVNISIAPTVTGSWGTFAPTLALTLNEQQLGTGSDAKLTVTEGDTAKGADTPRLNILMFSMPVWNARIIGLLLLLGAGAVLLWLRSIPEPESRARSAAARSRYQAQIIGVDRVPNTDAEVIEVPDVESLAKIAKRYALLIFMHRTDSADIFFTQDDGVRYQCTIRHSRPTFPQQGPTGPTGPGVTGSQEPNGPVEDMPPPPAPAAAPADEPAEPSAGEAPAGVAGATAAPDPR